ncbi:MAG TPA: tetratricopeptide repeat protein [Blastocatellia bacterium]
MMKAITAHAAPYAGLRVYSEQDAAFFFGRDRLRDLIISNLRSSRLTLLFGPSGVGKSSVLCAGVARELKRLGQENLDQNGKPEVAVAVFNSWRDDPLIGLAAAVEEAVEQALGGAPIEPPPPSSSLVERFGAWAKRVGGDLFVILDQFEDYFLYREYGEGDVSFALELARMVNHLSLRVNFLLSIRDDAYSKLEQLKARISNIYANALRIDDLDIKAARAAIEKPIDQYNRFYAASHSRVRIEPELVEELLETLRTGRLSLGESGRGVIKREGGDSEREPTVEAPFLQLVMTELWKAEMLDGSTTLRLQTLKSLGGAGEIVKTHLAGVMQVLTEDERDLAASAFNFLVTPSGNKIPYTASDLAASAEVDRNKLVPLLEKFTGSGRRILRSSGPAYPAGEPRYEFRHDVLAKAAFAWRTKYRNDQKTEEEKRQAAEKARAEERARRAAILRWARRGLALAFLLIAVSTFIAIDSERKRKAEETLLKLKEATTLTSDTIASLYQAFLQTKDPKKSAEDLQAALFMLNNALAIYQEEGNSAGEGIARNQIGGLYREMGRSAAGLENYQTAQNYYQQAQEQYEKARKTLQRALGPDHIDVANSINDLAYTYMLTGKYSQAEPLFEQALAIYEKAQPDTRYVADRLGNLAECYDRQGGYEKAEPLYKRVVEIRTSNLDVNPRAAIESLSNLAFLYFERGKYAEAERRFNEALDVWNNSKKPQPSDAVPMYDGLAAIYRERGEYDKAEQFLHQVRQLHKELVEYDHTLVADDLENMALVRLRQNSPGTQVETEQLFREVLRIRDNALGRDHPDTASAASDLAFFYLKQGKLKPAEENFVEALKIQEALPYSPALATTLYGLARSFRDQGRYDEAEPLFKRALAIQEKAIPDHPDLIETLNDYADLLRKMNRGADASQLEARAAQIIERRARERLDQ